MISEIVVYFLTQNEPKIMDSLSKNGTDGGFGASEYKFDIFEYILENLTTVIRDETAGFLKHKKISMRIIQELSIDKLLNFKTSLTGSSLLKMLVLRSPSDVIWSFLKKTMSKDEPKEVLRSRMTALLKKDESGLNIVDFSFLCHRYTVGEYLTGISKLLGGESGSDSSLNVVFPRLVKINLRAKKKQKEVIEQESETMARSFEWLSRFGGDWGEDKPVPDSVFEGLEEEQLEPYTKTLKTNEGVEVMTSLKALLDDLHRWDPEKENKKASDGQQGSQAGTNQMEEKGASNKTSGDTTLPKTANVNREVKYDIAYKPKKSFFSLFNYKNFECEYIDTVEKLAIAASEMKDQLLLTFDVEFLTLEQQFVSEEKKVRSLAASIQIGHKDKAYFVDCIKCHSGLKEHLKSILEDKSIIKVFHSPEGDIYTIYQVCGAIVNNVWDTARVDRLLGKLNHTRSLKTLSKEILHLEVDKTFQTANWRVRPLPRGMIEYGISDAFLLLPIFWWQYQEVRKVVFGARALGKGVEGVGGGLMVDEGDFGFELKVWAKCNHIHGYFKKMLDFYVVYEILDEEKKDDTIEGGVDADGE